MRGYPFALLVVIANLTCGTEPDISSQSSAVTAEEPEILPASAAGSPSGSAPGTPIDFTGTVRESIPITQEELDAIRAGEALEVERNPPDKKPSDLGFGVAKPKPQPQVSSQEAP